MPTYSPGGGGIMPFSVNVSIGKQEVTEVVVEWINTSDGTRKLTRTVKSGIRNNVN
jgi:hypothetical protein